MIISNLPSNKKLLFRSLEKLMIKEGRLKCSLSFNNSCLINNLLSKYVNKKINSYIYITKSNKSINKGPLDLGNKDMDASFLTPVFQERNSSFYFQLTDKFIIIRYWAIIAHRKSFTATYYYIGMTQFILYITNKAIIKSWCTVKVKHVVTTIS